MPDDPRLGKYMEEYGYNPIPFPFFKGTGQGRNEPPHVYARRQGMRSLANIASALLQRRRTGKNEEAREKAEGRITAEDQARFQSVIRSLRAQNLNELADAAEISGELPSQSQIAKALKDERENASQAQALASKQASLPVKMPMDEVPSLSEETGLPEGPMSVRPETAMEMGGDIGDIRRGRERGGRLFDYIQSFAEEEDPRKLLEEELVANWNAYQAGEKSFDEAASAVDQKRRLLTGAATPEERLSYSQARGAIVDERQLERADRAHIKSAYTQYVNRASREWDRYNKEIEKRRALPSYQVKLMGPEPKPPEAIKDFAHWLYSDESTSAQQLAPRGYDFYTDQTPLPEDRNDLPPENIVDLVEDAKRAIRAGQFTAEQMLQTAEDDPDLRPYLDWIRRQLQP